MLQAVEAPLLKMVAVAGMALGITALVDAPECKQGPVHRLVLHAPEEPNALYLTAWSDGDVFVTMRDHQARPITFKTRAFINDGCEWLGTERLLPDGEGRYLYSYDETILSCEPGATPARKTPRKGYVDSLPVR